MLERAVTGLLLIEGALLLVTQPGVAALFAVVWFVGRLVGVRW